MCRSSGSGARSADLSLTYIWRQTHTHTLAKMVAAVVSWRRVAIFSLFNFSCFRWPNHLEYVPSLSHSLTHSISCQFRASRAPVKSKWKNTDACGQYQANKYCTWVSSHILLHIFDSNVPLGKLGNIANWFKSWSILFRNIENCDV